MDTQFTPPQTDNPGASEVIKHLALEITGGKHWYLALLEAIRLWPITEETYNNRNYNYLIGGEAFDWLLLAERLCQSVDNLIPEAEKTALLFNGRPPIELTPAEFRQLIGNSKYLKYLNYFYGIIAEEALLLAVQDEVRKERWGSGYTREHNVVSNEAHRRIYGSTRAILLKRFRRERGYPQLKSIGINELNKFTYWLFKYRLKNSDKARAASDTKKALSKLNKLNIYNLGAEIAPADKLDE